MRTPRRFAASPIALATVLLAAVAALAGAPDAAMAFPGTAFPADRAPERGPDAGAALQDDCAEAGEAPARCACLQARPGAGHGPLPGTIGHDPVHGPGHDSEDPAPSADPRSSSTPPEAGIACGTATASRARRDR